MKIIGANLDPRSPNSTIYGDRSQGKNFGGLSNNNMRSTASGKQQINKASNASLSNQVPDAASNRNVTPLKGSNIKQLLSNHKPSDQGEDYANEGFEED